MCAVRRVQVGGVSKDDGVGGGGEGSIYNPQCLSHLR